MATIEPAPADLTLNEAGYVVGQSSTAINRAVDRGLIQARIRGSGAARLRRIGPVELRTLAIVAEVEKDVTPAARKKIYAAMRDLPADATRLEIGVMGFRLADIDERIAERLGRLDRIRAQVKDKTANPSIGGMNVYAVAALAEDQSEDAIRVDYPTLSTEQVEVAIAYAKLYPRTGRPLPTRSFKRMLGDLAESGVWDVESDDRPVHPRIVP